VGVLISGGVERSIIFAVGVGGDAVNRLTLLLARLERTNSRMRPGLHQASSRLVVYKTLENHCPSHGKNRGLVKLAY